MLDEICRHCNNYFNPSNDPTEPGEYPPAFLSLVGRIEDYTGKTAKTSTKSESNAGYGYTLDLEYTSWQKAFSQDLSQYKRARFI